MHASADADHGPGEVSASGSRKSMQGIAMSQYYCCLHKKRLRYIVMTSDGSLEAKELLADRTLRGSVQLGQPQAQPVGSDLLHCLRLKERRPGQALPVEHGGSSTHRCEALVDQIQSLEGLLPSLMEHRSVKMIERVYVYTYMHIMNSLSFVDSFSGKALSQQQA